MDSSSSSCNITKNKKGKDPLIKDIYFRRFFVPLIISLLILCGIVVIVSTPPGTGIKWDTFATAFGDTAKTVAKVGGRRR